MAPLQPFETHDADVASLETCGAGLVSKAAEGLNNGKLTKDAYNPAFDTVRGSCAPQIEAADIPVQQGSQEVTAELAWAAVVSRYWGTQVKDFNARVEQIKSQAWEDIAADDDDHDGEKREIRRQARADWWAAHEKYIEGGRDKAKAMLRDGPTKGHMQTAIDVGVMPPTEFDLPTWQDYWSGFLGIWVPPEGDQMDRGFWGAKAALLGTLWYGHAHHKFATNRFMPLPPLSPQGRFLSSGWTHGFGAYFNPNNWQQRYNMSSYQWQRNPLTFQRQLNPTTNWGQIARAADKGFYALTFASSAYDQWNRDDTRTDLSTGEKVTRSATRGAVKLAGTYAGIETGAWAGAAIGTAVGGPIGSVVGGMIGGVVGGVIGSGLADEVADHAVEGVTTAYNWTADRVEEVGEWAGDTLEDAGEVVSDVGDALTFWD